MAKVSLRPRQYKRLGRLAAKNPERAERVAGRMVERDTRKERGQEFIEANKNKLVPPTPTMQKGGPVKKSIKKAQKGIKTKASRDSVPSEMFPGKMIPRSSSNYENGFNIATGRYETPKKSAVPVKKATPKKKMKDGGSFGMLSVKAGVDKNPKPTAADRIAGAKMKAGKMKKGGKVSKKK